MAASKNLSILWLMTWMFSSGYISESKWVIGPFCMVLGKEMSRGEVKGDVADMGLLEIPLSDPETANKGQAVEFARQMLSNQTTFTFKERVDEIIDATFIQCDEFTGIDRQYNITLRLNESDCRKGNKSCDPSFNLMFYPVSREVQLIAELEPAMAPGNQIEIQGVIPLKAKGFRITLQTDYKRPMAAQLRINANFSYDGTDIRLEYFNETWNLIKHFNGFLETETAFNIIIGCLESSFQIYINKQFVASVPHILPYKDATHLSIFGDIYFTNLTGIGVYISPDEYEPSETWLDDNIQYQRNPYVPFVAPLSSPLKPGRKIEITGVIPLYSARFAITIQDGSKIKPEIAHLRLLVDFLKGDNYSTSMMYYDGSSWKDERFLKPVLTPGFAFRIVITSQPDGFKVSIDEQVSTFPYHDIPLTQAKFLSVLGMINITEVVGIGELPQVSFLDKPAVSPYTVPLKTGTLAPGQKLKLWTYIPEKFGNFSVNFEDANKTTIYLHLNFSFASSGSSFAWNTYESGKWGNEQRFSKLTWLKQGQPLQIEISCLEKTYEVIYYGLWDYSFSYRLPLNKAAQVDFPNRALLVHAVDGAYANPLPSPQSRVCSMIVRRLDTHSGYRAWLKDLTCTFDNSLLNSEILTMHREA